MGCPCKNKKKAQMKVSQKNKTSQTLQSQSIRVRPKTNPNQSGYWKEDPTKLVDVWLTQIAAPSNEVVTYQILVFRQESVGQLPVFEKEEKRMVFKGQVPQVVVKPEETKK